MELGCALFSDELGGCGTKVGDFPEVLFSDELVVRCFQIEQYVLLVKLAWFGCIASLSDLTGGEVYLKLENLQQSGSFKIRGAYNKMIHLSDEEKACGVVRQVPVITHKVLRLVPRS